MSKYLALNQNDGWMNKPQTNQHRDPKALLVASQQEQETSFDAAYRFLMWV